MNRIDARFAALRAARRTALVPFVTAGDPVPDATVEVLHALVDAGADLLELGVPFSDPMADGSAIQHANERALQKHVGLRQVLEWVARFRARDATTPVVLMGYLNPIEIHGHARFARDARAAGVDGVLVVDCPLEESQCLAELPAHGLHRILLAAPTSGEARLAALCDAARGFLYYVSVAGVTGAGHMEAQALQEPVAALRARSPVPVAVGFGIKDAQTACQVAAYADAVVIGSALVECIAAANDSPSACAAATAFLAPIRAALDARGAAHGG